VPVPEKRLPFFKVGKELKELVNSPLADGSPRPPIVEDDDNDDD
jgi:integration host factor subunit beta